MIHVNINEEYVKMGTTVHYEGKLVKLKDGGNIERLATRLLNNNDIERDDECYDTALDQLVDECDNYVLVDDVIWEVVDKTERDPDDNIFEAFEGSDGVIRFNVRYYNSGYGFSEAIEEALQNLQELADE